MVQAQIYLFLDAVGRRAYPGWLRFFGQVVRQFDGFVNIQMLELEGKSNLGMVLIFEDREHLDAFFASAVFGQLMRRMKPHFEKPYRRLIVRARNLYDYKKPVAENKSFVETRPDQMQSPAREASEAKKSDGVASAPATEESGKNKVVEIKGYQQAQ
ncbi:MAG: hypothetical protein ACQES2_03345 [Pseudomonadota bacterium]